MNPFKLLKALLCPAPRLKPTECADRIRDGQAILVDVREPTEWAQGVADQAMLLPFSDLTGSRMRWEKFLTEIGTREVLVYCATGGRSRLAASLLAAEGVWATNTGGLTDWKKSGWPLTPPPNSLN